MDHFGSTKVWGQIIQIGSRVIALLLRQGCGDLSPSLPRFAGADLLRHQESRPQINPFWNPCGHLGPFTSSRKLKISWSISRNSGNGLTTITNITRRPYYAGKIESSFVYRDTTTTIASCYSLHRFSKGQFNFKCISYFDHSRKISFTLNWTPILINKRSPWVPA